MGTAAALHWATTAGVGFPAASQTPARARCFARALLDRWRLATLTDDVSLVVTELVTNALRHTATTSACDAAP